MLIARFGLWLADFGHAVVILVLAMCLGYPAARRFLRGPAAVPLMLLTGLAMLSAIVGLLSWVRAFTSLGMIVVGVLAVAVTAWFLAGDVARWRAEGGPRWWDRRVLLCIGTLALAAFLLSWLVIYPATGDGVNYHLPLARDLVQQHGLHYDPYVRYSFFPQANEALFAVVQLMTKNASAASALEYSVLVIGALTLPVWFIASGRRAGAGLVAGLVFLASPVVIWVGALPMVDDWTMVFVLAGTLVGLDAVEGRMPQLAGFAIMGGLLGEAAATKYQGIPYAGCAILAVLITAGRSRIRLIDLCGTAWGAVAIALPWYAWTIHTTGDPVYPFATSLFGNREGLWNAAEVQFQVLAARTVSQSGIWPVFSHDIQYLLGNVLFNTGPHRSPLSWWLGSGYLGFLFKPARRDRAMLGLALVGAIAIAISVVASADPRYLVPAFGLFAVLAGMASEYGLAALSRRAPPRIRNPRLAPVGCLIAAVVVLWSAFGYERWFRDAYGLPPVSSKATHEWLDAQIPCYPAVMWLNEHAGASYRAWAYNCDGARYYANGRLISDAFSDGARDRIYDGGTVLPPPGVLWTRLQPLDVGWMILPTQPPGVRAELQGHHLFTFVDALGDQDVFSVVKAP